jgi:hypothetical protein
MISFILNRWQLALVFYVVFVLTILATKPAMLFEQNGAPKRWGPKITDDTSPFAIAFLFPFVGILFYYIATVLDFSVSGMNRVRA